MGNYFMLENPIPFFFQSVGAGFGRVFLGGGFNVLFQCSPDLVEDYLVNSSCFQMG